MKYHEVKLRALVKLFFLGLAVGAVSLVLLYGRTTLEPFLGRRFIGFAWGMMIAWPLAWGIGLWMLFMSPAQEVRFLHWAEKFGQKPSPEFDWTLLDPSDPDYNRSTIGYLFMKRRGDGGGTRAA